MTIRRISAAFLFVIPALAQAAPQPQPRTFVSAKEGSDSANCSRTSPCRTFSRAIAMTVPGGEVVVLDSGGYGAVTINQAVSLEAPDGVYAGITASSGDAITVASGVNDVVVLRGLTLVGAGTSGNGITVASAGTVHVEHCSIRGFAAGNGVAATQSAFFLLYVEDSQVSECNVGLNVLPAPGRVTLTSGLFVSRSRFHTILNEAILIVGADDSDANIKAVLTGSDIHGFFGGAGVLGSKYVELTVDRCAIAGTGGFESAPDLWIDGNSQLFVTNSVMPNIGGGLRVSGGASACSLGNNFINNVVGTLQQCPLR